MGSLGDVIKAQAQYNWVGKPNCTEMLHLLQWGNYYWYLVDFPGILLGSYA